MAQKGADFELANRAYERMTLSERERVMERFAQLQYPSVLDRFFEAVHAVITASPSPTDRR